MTVRTCREKIALENGVDIAHCLYATADKARRPCFAQSDRGLTWLPARRLLNTGYRCTKAPLSVLFQPAGTTSLAICGRQWPVANDSQPGAGGRLPRCNLGFLCYIWSYVAGLGARVFGSLTFAMELAFAES